MFVEKYVLLQRLWDDLIKLNPELKVLRRDVETFLKLET